MEIIWIPELKKDDYFKVNSIKYKLLDNQIKERLFDNIIIYHTEVEIVEVPEKGSSGKEKIGDKMYLIITENKEFYYKVESLRENIINKIKRGALLKDNDKIKEAKKNNDELGMLSAFAEHFQCRKLLNQQTEEYKDHKHLYFLFFEHYEENTIRIRDYLEIKNSRLSESETRIIIINLFELLLKIYEAEIDYPKKLIDGIYIYIQINQIKNKLKKDFKLSIDYFVFHPNKSRGGTTVFMTPNKLELYSMPERLLKQSNSIWALGNLCYYLLEGENVNELTPFLKLKPFKEENQSHPKLPSMDCQMFLKYCLQVNPYKRINFETLKDFNFLNKKIAFDNLNENSSNSLNNKSYRSNNFPENSSSISQHTSFLYIADDTNLKDFTDWDDFSEKDNEKKESHRFNDTLTIHYADSDSIGEDHEELDKLLEPKVRDFFEKIEKEDIREINKLTETILIPSYPDIN